MFRMTLVLALALTTAVTVQAARHLPKIVVLSKQSDNFTAFMKKLDALGLPDNRVKDAYERAMASAVADDAERYRTDVASVEAAP